MGFAPADDPKIVLLVVIDEPRGESYGGVVAAPVFKAIMEKVLPYLNVHPKGTLIVKKGADSILQEESRDPRPSSEEVSRGKGSGRGRDAGSHRIVDAQCIESHRRERIDHQAFREWKGGGTGPQGRDSD